MDDHCSVYCYIVGTSIVWSYYVDQPITVYEAFIIMVKPIRYTYVVLPILYKYIVMHMCAWGASLPT